MHIKMGSQLFIVIKIISFQEEWMGSSEFGLEKLDN
jgi:hypothetical protein